MGMNPEQMEGLEPEYEFWRDLRPPKPSAEKEEN